MDSNPQLKTTLSGATLPAQPSQASGRSKVALVIGSDIKLTAEIETLLRSRLRIMALIIFTTGSILTLIDVVVAGTAAFAHPQFISQLCICLALALVNLGLCHPLVRTVGALRLFEVIFLAIMVFFFSYFQWQALRYEHLGLGLERHDALDAFIEKSQRYSFKSSTLRWTLFIVIYGTFIPNTWRRCAAVAGTMAITPVLLNIAFYLIHGRPATLMEIVPAEQVVALALATVVAIFGSYKIGTLHEQVFEAKKLGQYRLIRPLGGGGMGRVYLAEHMLLRRPCAIKMLKPGRGDPEGIARFEREVRLTAKLTHWNTIEIYDYGHTEDGVFYYAMEYLPGMSLDHIVERHGAMNPARAVHILRQVCQALREAHAIGLLHRDLKPGNIIVCERGKIYDVAKLLDFGLVKPIGDELKEVKLTQAGYLAGTPAYMSPEQALGRDSLDARSDVYSLGAAFYEVLTGQLPFHSATPMAMLTGHVQQPVKPLREVAPSVPADVEAVIMKCMEKDPDARYQDMDAMEAALLECACANQWTQAYAAAWWQRLAPKEPDVLENMTSASTEPFEEVSAASTHRIPAAF